MSHYANYRRERENAIVVEDEFGFAAAVEHGEYMYIDEIYVDPKNRRSNIAFNYADEITKIAKERGFKKLLGSVDPKAIGSTVSMKVLLAYGFKLLTVENELIYLCKEIKNG